MTTQYVARQFNNGQHVLERGQTYRVRAARRIFNEDWKTATARGQRAIEVGELGYLKGEPVNNMYGEWASVRFDDVDFSLYTDFSALEMVAEDENKPDPENDPALKGAFNMTLEEIREMRVAIWMMGNVDTLVDLRKWHEDYAALQDRVSQDITKEEAKAVHPECAWEGG